MNARSLFILGGATLVVLIVTIVTLNSRASAVRGATETSKLFPDLLAHINDVAKIEIVRKEGTAVLQKEGDRWGLVQKSNYPVDLEPVAKMLIAMAEMTTVEPKTSDPARYEQLGVQEVSADKAEAADAHEDDAPDAHAAADPSTAKVTLHDANGTVLADLIVGKAHTGKGGGMGGLGAAGQTYVRKPGEAQSWLVKGSLDVKAKPVDWLAKEILKVPRDRIRAMTVTHPAASEGADGTPARSSASTARSPRTPTSPCTTSPRARSSRTRRSRVRWRTRSSGSTSRTWSPRARSTSPRIRERRADSRPSTASC